MRCSQCGTEYQPGQEQCLVCKASLNQVKVMTQEEREHFGGMTIEQQDDERNDRFQGYSQSKNRVYFRQVSFGSGSSMGFLTKLILGAGIVALVMFVALPLMLLFTGVAILAWFFFRRVK